MKFKRGGADVMAGTFTPERYGIVQLYQEVHDAEGDPVVIVKMAMDRETAEAIFQAANSECTEAHERLLNIVRDLSLGALQVLMSREIDKLVS